MIERAGDGLQAILHPPRASAFTYVEGSKVALIAIMLAVAAIPDTFFLWLFVPHRLWWLALGLDIAEIWSALWLLGLYGTMARDPHSIEGNSVTLHNGSLQSIAFDRSAVASATTLGRLKRRKLPRRRGDGSLVLALGGVPIVDIRLLVPIHGISRVFVASDRPDSLAMMLTGGAG